MSFSINEAKVDELLRSSKKGYEMSSSDLPPSAQSENYTSGGHYYVASGTVYAPPTLVTEETRQHMMLLRRRIEESGVPLKDVAELSREINEMKGRR